MANPEVLLIRTVSLFSGGGGGGGGGGRVNIIKFKGGHWTHEIAVT